METPAPAPMIRFESVGRTSDDGTVAVHDLSLEVNAGEICALVGPSGCGKTTAMRMANRLGSLTTGRILINGRDIATEDPVDLRRGIGYVIQQVGLFPHQSVRTNVGTVCRLLKWDEARIAARADEMLDMVGLDPHQFGDRYPNQLSGGQRQRVGVARALAADPPVLLMDEPFGAVDPVARAQLQGHFHTLVKSLGTTVMMVTHDIDEAVRLGDRIAVMRAGGVLEQYAAPAELLARPATDFVADFVGSDRVLRGLVRTPIERSLLDSPGPQTATSSPQLHVGDSLRVGLSCVLAEPSGSVSVLENGEVVGALTMDAVHRHLRRPAEAA